eukprot:4678841-Pleurochrysis_carterae.AAC.1
MEEKRHAKLVSKKLIAKKRAAERKEERRTRERGKRGGIRQRNRGNSRRRWEEWKREENVEAKRRRQESVGECRGSRHQQETGERESRLALRRARRQRHRRKQQTGDYQRKERSLHISRGSWGRRPAHSGAEWDIALSAEGSELFFIKGYKLTLPVECLQEEGLEGPLATNEMHTEKWGVWQIAIWRCAEEEANLGCVARMRGRGGGASLEGGDGASGGSRW